MTEQPVEVISTADDEDKSRLFQIKCGEQDSYERWLVEQRIPLDSAHILYYLPLSHKQRDALYKKLTANPAPINRSASEGAK